jgi:hypothetical protein
VAKVRLREESVSEIEKKGISDYARVNCYVSSVVECLVASSHASTLFPLRMDHSSLVRLPVL